MAVYKRDIIDINLETGNIYRSWLKHSIGMKDQKADHFGVRVFRNGEAVSLTGVSVQGVFMPPQGSPIAITSGNIVSGNVAEVVLPQACYNYDGQFTLAIKLVDASNSVTGTVRIVDGMVDNTHASGTVAPTSAVPTYQEVLSVYEQAITVIGNSVRFDQSQSLTDTQKGTARTNIAAASESELSDVKSAIDSVEDELEIVIETYESINIWNPEGIGYYNRYGTYYSSSNQKRMRIYVTEGDVFRIYRWGTYDYVEKYKASPTMRLCAFDSSGNAISTIDVSDASSYTVPSGVASLDLSINIAINAEPLVTLNTETVPTEKTDYFAPYLTAKTDTTLSVEKGIADAKTTGQAISGLDDRVNVLEENVLNKYEIVFPNKMFMTPNQQLNIYNDNIINGDIGTDKYIEYSVNSFALLSKSLNDHIQINPTEAGFQYGFIYVKDKITGNTLKQKQFSIYCTNHMASEKKIIYIGDSLTDIGYYPAMMKINSNDKLVSIGTREREVTIDGNSYTVKNEGRGGWSAMDYVTKASDSGMTNAFFNPSSQKFDFSYYMTENNFSGVDIVCINLGTNGTSRADDTCDAIDEMISSIHAYDSDILILVSLITPGASQDGWGNLVHTASADEFKRTQMTLIKKYLAKYQDVITNVHVNPWYVNLDRLHDFGTSQYALSSRNPEIVTLQNNNVHPSVYGYWKMADVLYSTICYYLAN